MIFAILKIIVLLSLFFLVPAFNYKYNLNKLMDLFGHSKIHKKRNIAKGKR